MGVSMPCHPMPGLGVKVGSLGLYPPGDLGVGSGVLLHAGTTRGDWEGLVPVGAGQWAAAGGCWPEDTPCHRAAFCVHLDSGRSVPAWGEWGALRVSIPRTWGAGKGGGGVRQGSPSSSLSSGTAREADARAAARNTITLPRPGMGLCIWRRQSGEEEGVIPCNGVASSIHSSEHPCRTTDPTSSSCLAPPCQGHHRDRTTGTPARTAGRVCATVTAGP